jgi:Matrixin
LRRLVLFPISLFVILCSCVGGPPLKVPPNNPFHPPVKEVYISALFSADEVKQIELGLKTIMCDTEYKLIEYRVHLNSRRMEYLIAETTDSLIIEKALSSDPRIAASDIELTKKSGDLSTIGLFLETQQAVPTILLVVDRLGENRQLWLKVALHELCHALNMGHSTNEHSILYPRADQAADNLTEADLQSLRNLYHFKSTDFHLCQFCQ